MATTFDRLADLHEAFSHAPGHPLEPGAGRRAVAERRIAVREREAADWFRSIASGDHRSGVAAGANGSA